MRAEVKKVTRYAEYREHLRVDFWFSCAYCSLSETESQAIRFEIDHYHPQCAPFPGLHAYDNLMWSCEVCNRLKSDCWECDEDQAAGYRFVRPDVDDPNEHFSLLEDRKRIEATSKPGEYTFEILNLNRKVLMDIRDLRNRMALSADAIIGGLQALNEIRLDRLHPALRSKFKLAAERASGQHGKLQEELDRSAIVRVLNESPLLDPDPDKHLHARRRKQYLESIRTNCAKSCEPTAPPPDDGFASS